MSDLLHLGHEVANLSNAALNSLLGALGVNHLGALILVGFFILPWVLFELWRGAAVKNRRFKFAYIGFVAFGTLMFWTFMVTIPIVYLSVVAGMLAMGLRAAQRAKLHRTIQKRVQEQLAAAKMANA